MKSNYHMHKPLISSLNQNTRIPSAMMFFFSFQLVLLMLYFLFGSNTPLSFIKKALSLHSTHPFLFWQITQCHVQVIQKSHTNSMKKQSLQAFFSSFISSHTFIIKKESNPHLIPFPWTLSFNSVPPLPHHYHKATTLHILIFK